MPHPRHQPVYNTTLALLAALTLLAAGTHTAHAAEHFCGQTSAHPIDKAQAAAAERSGGVTVDHVPGVLRRRRLRPPMKTVSGLVGWTETTERNQP